MCSAVGLLPLSLHFGSAIVDKFLAGAAAVDDKFFAVCDASADDLGKGLASGKVSLPLLLGLLSVWNVSYSA